jgi:hypothetical protein
MLEQKQKEKKPPRLAMWGMVAAGTAVILILLLTPWNFIPVQVTEDVTVIANMKYGCVGESQYGVSVVVPECGAQVGDIVSATFYVPAMKLNGYYDRIQDKVEMVIP